MLISKSTLARLVCYEEGDAGDAGAAAAAAAAAAGTGAVAGGAGDGKPVTTQAELNTVLKQEKEKFRKEREKLAKQLEDASKLQGLSDEAKAGYESQIEELRNANLSTEELARKNQEKLSKEWQTKHQAATQEATQWKSRHDLLHIGHDIAAESSLAKVLPTAVEFIEAKLIPKSRLVDIVDEDGKPTGRQVSKVHFDSTDKEGKPVVLDITIKEAIKLMKDNPERYGMFFEGTAAGGLGAGTGQSNGKKVDLANMSMEDFAKKLKENPNALFASAKR